MGNRPALRASATSGRPHHGPGGWATLPGDPSPHLLAEDAAFVRRRASQPVRERRPHAVGRLLDGEPAGRCRAFSELTIRTLLVNHRRLEREDLDEDFDVPAT